MVDIKIEKLDKAAVEKRGISKWPIWTKEVSRLDWHYDSTEECYMKEDREEAICPRRC